MSEIKYSNWKILKQFQGTFSDIQYPCAPAHWALTIQSTELLSSGASLTSWGEGASLALVGHHSSDGVTTKILYGVDVFLNWSFCFPCTPSFPIGLVKIGFDLTLLLDQLQLA